MVFLVLLQATLAVGEDWSEFRGPSGQGHSSERGLPLVWSETKNISWKVPISGHGWSSPVIQRDQIWLTTALDQGHSLRAICLAPDKGQILHDVEVFRKDNPGSIHSKNSHASPTPILEGNRVYVHYGANGTACLSDDGSILWKTKLEYQHGHGPGGSPVLFQDLLLISCDGTDIQYIVALDKHTGKIRWKRDRGGRMAYSTPLIIRVNSTDQLVSTGGDRVVAYNPLTGKELWWVRYDGYSLVPRPLFGLDLVFICSGYSPPYLYAIRPDGKDDVTESHVVWRVRRGAPLNPSPLLVGKELYMVSDRGIASCLNATTGESYWRERLGGEFSASPVYADGRIYFLNEEGQATAVSPGTEFKKLATNSLDGRTLASMAVFEQSFYVRTDRHLYRITKSSSPKLQARLSH